MNQRKQKLLELAKENQKAADNMFNYDRASEAESDRIIHESLAALLKALAEIVGENE